MYLRLVNSSAAVLFTMSSFQAFPASCIRESEQLEKTAVLFTGVIKGVTLEPEGIEVPDVAKVPIDVPIETLEEVPDGEDFTIEGCSSVCFSWTGTVEDLPATYVRQWRMLYVDVYDVWRGSVAQKETVYLVGSRMPEVGQEFAMGFYETQISPLSYEGTCQPLLVGDTLSDFVSKETPPIYSYR